MENFQEVAYEPTENPTDEEVAEYCQYLGLDPNKDPDLLWIALEGIKAPLPDGWIFFQHKHKNESFFYNKISGISINEHPLDSHYLNLFKEEKRKKAAKLKPKKSPTNRLEKSMIVTPKSNDLINNSPQSKTTDQIRNKLAISDESMPGDDLFNDSDDFLQKIENPDIKTDEKPKDNASNDDIHHENKSEEFDEINSLDSPSESITDAENSKNNQVKATKVESEQKIQEIKQKCQNEIEKLKQKCENEKKRIIQNHNVEIAKLKESQQQEIEKFMQQHKKVVENMRKAHEEKIKMIKEKAESHINEISNVQEPEKDNDAIAEETKKQEQRLINLRAQYEKDFAAQQRENSNKLNALRNECESEIKRYKRQLHADKQKIFAAARKDAQKRAISECLENCNIDTFKVISFKPRPDRLKGILRRSPPFSLNLVDDEYYGDLNFSPNVIIFTRSSTIKSSGSSDSFTEIEPVKERKGALRGNYITESSIDSSDSEDAISPSTKTAQKVKREAVRTNERFSSAAEKTVMSMGNAFSDIESKSNQLRSFCAEENRGITKLSMEFQQKTLEISKMFHETLMVLEDAHRAALNTAMTPREIIPPIQPVLSPPIRMRGSAKRLEYNDDYDDDDFPKESPTQKYMRLYQKEQHSARSASNRLKRKFAEILVDSDPYSN